MSAWRTKGRAYIQYVYQRTKYISRGIALDGRKIQKVGTSTLTVSLPRDWVEEQGLQKGDQLFIVREGEALRIVPPAVVQRRKQEVREYVVDADACEDEGMLERIIVGNYVLGRERIVVRSSLRLEGDQLEEIRGAVKRLMGMGIIEETANRVLLQCSLDPIQYPIEPLIKRLYTLAVTMFDEALEALLTRDASLADEAMKREDDSDMIYWLIVRLVLSAQQDEGLIQKLGMESRLNNAGYRVIAKELEAAADDAAVMAQAVKELLVKGFDLDGPLMGGLKEFNNEVKGLFTNALAALLTRDLRLANQTVTARKRLRARQDQLGTILANRARDPFVVLRLRTILDALSRTADISTSIANIAFNRYLERSTAVCREQVLKA